MFHRFNPRSIVSLSACAALGATLLAAPSASRAEPTSDTRPTIDIDAELDRVTAEERHTSPYPVPAIYEPPKVLIDELSRDRIAQVQTALKALGYPIGRADGIVGAPTRMSLNALLAAMDWPDDHALTPVALRGLGIPIDDVQ